MKIGKIDEEEIGLWHMSETNSKYEDRTIIFLHIPKAAGMTIYRILGDQYNDTESYRLQGNPVIQAIEEFKKLPQESKNKIRILYGHMHFGLHRQFTGKTAYFTLLREPVDRIISHYYYVLKTPSHYLYEKVLKYKMNLKEYVSSGISKELNNSQLRYISGGDPCIDLNKCSHDLLDKTKTILDEFFVVTGIKELFDETLIMLRKALNWKRPPVYIKQNVTKNRPKKEDLDNETIETIKKYNQLDIDLYHVTAANFKEKMKSLGGSFQEELKAFKILNTHWQQFGNGNRLNYKFLSRRNKTIVKDIKNSIEILRSEGDRKTALCLAKDAIALYPRAKKLERLLNSF